MENDVFVPNKVSAAGRAAGLDPPAQRVIAVGPLPPVRQPDSRQLPVAVPGVNHVAGTGGLANEPAEGVMLVGGAVALDELVARVVLAVLHLTGARAGLPLPLQQREVVSRVVIEAFGQVVGQAGRGDTSDAVVRVLTVPPVVVSDAHQVTGGVVGVAPVGPVGAAPDGPAPRAVGQDRLLLHAAVAAVDALFDPDAAYEPGGLVVPGVVLKMDRV